MEDKRNAKKGRMDSRNDFNFDDDRNGILLFD